MNKKQRNLIIQIGVVLVILVGIWLSFGRNILSTSKSPDVPAQLAGMKVGNIVEGAQALSQVNKLHGLDIQLEGAYIAEYSHEFNPYHNDVERVTVWVGKTGTVAESQALATRMYTAIQKSGSPFSDPQRISLNGREVFRVTGPGGQHYFYSSSSKAEIIWLIIESSEPQRILSEALGVF